MLAGGVSIGQEPSVAETIGCGFFTSILGFLIVFRAQLAYGRFWEGITLVERACGVWLNGVSNLVAFSSARPEKHKEVGAFQHLLSRLVSVLMSLSLSDISKMDELAFPTLNIDGINPESLKYLDMVTAKQKVVLQWIQRLVVENQRSGVIDIDSPILSRVFQEFSIGIVHFIDARKLKTVPFPLPFAQTMIIMLIFFCVGLVPIAAAAYLEAHKAGALTFVVVFSFASVHYISVDIEQPFGEAANNLPLRAINLEFNHALVTLLAPEAQQTPILVKTTEEMMQHVDVCKQIAVSRVISMNLGECSPCRPSLRPRPSLISDGSILPGARMRMWFAGRQGESTNELPSPSESVADLEQLMVGQVHSLKSQLSSVQLHPRERSEPQQPHRSVSRGPQPRRGSLTAVLRTAFRRPGGPREPSPAAARGARASGVALGSVPRTAVALSAQPSLESIEEGDCETMSPRSASQSAAGPEDPPEQRQQHEGGTVDVASGPPPAARSGEPLPAAPWHEEACSPASEGGGVAASEECRGPAPDGAESTSTTLSAHRRREL